MGGIGVNYVKYSWIKTADVGRQNYNG